jgi:1-acyl-sn-glycerol-3-phosphate acyltransferase
MIYWFVANLLRLIFATLFRWRIKGRENVPARGGVILASNHLSNLDPPLVSVAIWRPCAFMAKEELFEHRFFGWLIKNLNAFPVKRGTADRASLKKAVELLQAGWPLVMFPEGARSETGELQEPEMGVGMIVYRAGVPVVPVWVSGTDKAMPKGSGIKFTQIRVRYGPPITFPIPEGTRPGREEYEAAAHRIMDGIRELRDAEAAGR